MDPERRLELIALLAQDRAWGCRDPDWPRTFGRLLPRRHFHGRFGRQRAAVRRRAPHGAGTSN